MKRLTGVMMYRRKLTDPVLKAVMAHIHMTAEKPDKGFLSLKEWAKKWDLKSVSQAQIYVKKATDIGQLVTKRFRVVTEGRLRQLRHYGPPPKRKGA